MSIEKVREILGEEYKNCSDKEIEKITEKAEQKVQEPEDYKYIESNLENIKNRLDAIEDEVELMEREENARFSFFKEKAGKIPKEEVRVKGLEGIREELIKLGQEVREEESSIKKDLGKDEVTKRYTKQMRKIKIMKLLGVYKKHSNKKKS